MKHWNTSAIRATGLAILAAGSAFLSQNTSAATIIADWGGDYVTGANSFRLPTATDNGTTRTYKYSSSVSISPTGSGYVPPPGKSGTFYGALQLASAGSSPSLQTFNQDRIVDVVGGDRIVVTGNFPTAGNSVEVSGVIAFQKPNFLNSMSSPSSIAFDSTSSFSMSIASAVGSQSAQVRLAVLDGSQWYLSSSSYTATAAGTFSIANLNAENFGTWNLLSSSAPLPTAPTTFTTAGSSFSNIQAVGYYFDYSTVSTSERAGLQVSAFTVSAVPEPSTVFLMGLGVIAMFVTYRKRSAA